MTEMFSTLGTWNWLIFGFVLMALELIAPGVLPVLAGARRALGRTGVVRAASVLADAASDVRGVRRLRRAGMACGWRAATLRPTPVRSSTGAPRRWSAGVHPGEAIIDGAGTVRIDDTVWRVAGPDAPAGSRVKIVRVDGANLTVPRRDLV